MGSQSDDGWGTGRSTKVLLALTVGGIAFVLAVSAAGATAGFVGAVQDQYESNDEIGDAPTMEPGTYTELESQMRDPDYYAVEVAARDRLVVNVSYPDSAGDLDLVVYDDGRSDRVAESRSMGGGTERVVVDADEDDTFYVLVSGYETQATYDMSISVEQLPPVDRFEPNDDDSSAAAITPGTSQGLGIIDGEKDVYEFEVAAGDEIAARTVFERANGDLDLTIYGPDGSSIGEGNSLDPTEETVNATASSAGTYQLYVWGMAGVTTTYDLELAVGPDAASQFGSGNGGNSSGSGSGTGSGGGSGSDADGGSDNGAGSGSGSSNGSDDGSGGDSSSSDSGGMPGFGVPAALGGVFVALVVAKRRD